MRALLLIVVALTGCASARAQISKSFARPERLCLTALPGRAPPDVLEDVVSRVESSLTEIGVVVTREPPCDQTAEIALVGGYPWVFGWVTERITMRVRDSGGRLLATVEQAAPMGGTYVFYMTDDFTAAVVKAFGGKR